RRLCTTPLHHRCQLALSGGSVRVMRDAAVRSELNGDRRAVFDELVAQHPTVWIPGTVSEPRSTPAAGPAPAAGPPSVLSPALIDAAEDRFRFFAPLFEELFPETREQGGIIELPL